VLLGPPGAGKGTQAAKLSNYVGVPRISTGDILRKHVAEGTDLGKKAQAYMDAGKLVPDDLVIAMTERRLKEADARKGFILDGFPRTIAQAEALAKLVPLDAVINLFLEPEELIKRNTGRRVCPKCDAVYHVLMNRPRKEGICDRCGGPLRQRSDDTERVIAERLRAYREQTAPLILRYQKAGLLLTVDGRGRPAEVFDRIAAAVPDLRG